MGIHRGDIVEVSFPLPGNAYKPHPTLVISNDSVYLDEGTFIGVMLSGSSTNDRYSYFLDDHMLTKSPKKRTQVRCHLLAIIQESDVLSRHGILKKEYVDEIADKIFKEVLTA